MPFIRITAYDSNRCIRELDITAKIRFSQEYYRTPKAKIKLKELQEEF
jgi:hypothetical protein